MATQEAAQLLEAALDGSFTNVPSPEKVEAEVPASTTQAVSIPEPSTEPPPAEASTSSTEEYKAEYEAQVESWRAQSAEAREKAEQERAKWEAIRKEEVAQRKAGLLKDDSPPLWETSGLSTIDDPVSITSNQIPPPSSFESTQPASQNDDESSQKWEEVPSVTSSYPSMSFPEQIETPPVAPTQPEPRQPPTSVTLSIFDSSLSTRTRLYALASALTVNLLLPFVNGVMLGFGEIFAKNVVMEWFGWKPSARPGSVVAGVGIRKQQKPQRQTFIQ